MAAQDLTTLANVRAFLQKNVSDTAQDPLISSFITRASDAIMHDCDRRFLPAETAAAHTFEYTGGGWLDLSPFDLRSVSQIRLDTDETSPTTLATTDFRVYPQNAPFGVYTALRLAPYLVTSRARWQYRLVEVTGNWGWTSVPSDVEQACILTVRTWLRRDVSAVEAVIEAPEDLAVGRPMGIPSDAWSLLRPFARQAYA
jgi:hypothetical protein